MVSLGVKRQRFQSSNVTALTIDAEERKTDRRQKERRRERVSELEREIEG